jgi:hypothetical protein
MQKLYKFFLNLFFVIIVYFDANLAKVKIFFGIKKLVKFF